MEDTIQETIELVCIPHPEIEWGLMFYPAHSIDQAKFWHCTNIGLDYLFKGGVMAQPYVNIAMQAFIFHGLEPVIVDEDKATWDFPRFRREPTNGSSKG